jgi:hypothetical protein
MTRSLKFYGASDDLFEIEGYQRGEPDEISPDSYVKIMSGEIGLIVTAQYTRIGCWAIGICQIDEDQPIPDWTIFFTTGKPARGYSVVLNIEAPDDAIMTELKSKNRCHRSGLSGDVGE